MNRHPSIETLPSSARTAFRRRMFPRRFLVVGSRRYWRVFPTVCLIAALTSVAWADARFSLEGQLNLGTDQMDIPFNLSASVDDHELLAFRTWSHSGGTNGAGEVIPAGGFDPSLALLNSAATQIAYADDGTGIGLNYDSVLNFYGGAPAIPSPLAAGNYTLRLEALGDAFGTKTKNWAVDLYGTDNVLSLTLPSIDLVPGSAGISKVSVTGPGSKWTNSADLDVGYSGAGTLLVTAGGQVNNTRAWLGAYDGDGNVTVSGTGSLWNNSREIYVGGGGTGQITVSGGGRVNNTYAYLGAYSTGDGSVTVTGAGSIWNNTGDLYVGGNSVGPRGSGKLSVQESGLVKVAGALKIWNTGMVTLDEGTLSVGSIDAESFANLDFLAGTLNLTSDSLSVGASGSFGNELNINRKQTMNVTKLASVAADGTLVVFGGFSSGGLTNLGTTLFVNTTIAGTVNNATGSATNVVGNVVFEGLVSGGGGFFGSGTADFQGGVSPGASPARVNIEGSANFAASNTLFIELGGLAAGTEFDVLEIGGRADLGGTLDVSLLGGFIPSAGDRFDVLTAALVQGTFDTKSLPTLADGLQWLVDYRTDGMSLLVSSASLAGDYNGNGIVDAADYTMWRNNLGAPAGTLLNDPAGGVIGTAQYAQWKAHFGQNVGAGSGASSLAAVPEPATVVMLILGMLALRLPRRAAWSLACCGALAGSFVLTGPVQAAILIDPMSAGATDVSPSFPGAVPDPLVVAGSLTVGQTTSGAFEINGSSYATSADGSIGLNMGSTCVATVTGSNSFWLNNGNLSIGETGNGMLNILAGGHVLNGTGTIGRNLGSIGVVTVTGNNGVVNDSTWSNSGSLFVGYSGNGTLNGTPSGVVTSPTGFIGFNQPAFPR